MKFEELLAKEKDTPVLCVDGIVGMLVHYPSESAPASPAGVQVPGETEVRWIAQQELHRAGAALRGVVRRGAIASHFAPGRW